MENNPYTTPEAVSEPPVEEVANLTRKEILFSFKGRIPRSVYWGCSILITVAFYILLFAVGAIFGEESPITVAAVILCYIPMVWITLALQAKRWHDRDKSAWWILISLIPLVGPIWVFVENGCLKGTDGPNNFGPDPL